MQVIEDSERFDSDGGYAAVIGFFDGVARESNTIFLYMILPANAGRTKGIRLALLERATLD